MLFTQVSALISLVTAHGAMILPIPRNNDQSVPELVTAEVILTNKVHGCEGFSCLWFNQGCSPACEKCSGSNDTAPKCEVPSSFEPFIKSDQQPFLTFGKHAGFVDPKFSPWRSPGEAPVIDSCGSAAGGNPTQDPTGAAISPPNRRNAFPGTELPATNLTKWIIGKTAEVAFGVVANHGGGYQYRLCPADSILDEDCFKKLPLEFAGDKQSFYWTAGPKANQSVEVPATRVTARDGSVWSKNPIPAFACTNGGSESISNPRQEDCKEPQFKPLIEGKEFWGFSDYKDYTGKDPKPVAFLPYVKDFVKVPDVKPGHYVLSWRWDCEQTFQVWNSCSDIEISAEDIHV